MQLDVTQQMFSDLSNEKYHSMSGISASGIALMADCPARYYHRYLSGKYVKPDSKALIIGSAVHTIALEPDKFVESFAIIPGLDRRTKAGKADYEIFMEAHINKHHLKQDDYAFALAMGKALRNNRVLKSLISNDMCIEHSFFWTDENGAKLKSRPDFYCPKRKIIIDIKTTDSVKPSDFARSVITYGYPTQAALQIDALQRFRSEDFLHVIVAVEKEEPFLTASYMLPQDAIDLGRAIYKRESYIYKECLENNFWPDYGSQVIDIELPSYFYKSQGL